MENALIFNVIVAMVMQKENNMKVECQHCKQLINISPYFFNERITIEEDPIYFRRYYRAHVEAKAICPLCGHEFRKIYHQLVSLEDIISIATKGKGV